MKGISSIQKRIKSIWNRRIRKPLLSVVVPVYNGEKTIEQCINSIRNQTYDRIELIIVDDGSTDDTLCICQQIAE